MPDLKTFDQLATGYGLGTALLIVAALVLAGAVVRLYRENQALYCRIEALLKERVAALERLIEERTDGRRPRN